MQFLPKGSRVSNGHDRHFEGRLGKIEWINYEEVKEDNDFKLG